MTSLKADIRQIAGPIFGSYAFKRLSRISFLGILSVRHRTLPDFPLPGTVRGLRPTDGTRAEHSFRVARIAQRVIEGGGLPPQIARYAVAWGLIHDIATWPLSHTGEAAFAGCGGIQPGMLRDMIIYGAADLPARFSLYRPIKAMGLDHDILASLFKKQVPSLNPQLSYLHALIHSPLTPDTFEGMWRTGKTIGVRVPDSEDLIRCIKFNYEEGGLFDGSFSNTAFEFWRSKSAIYEGFINRTELIEYESRWSQAIADAYSGISVWESLELEERDIVRKILNGGLPAMKHIKKYKPPLSYQLSDEYKDQAGLVGSVPVTDLCNILVKRQMAL